MYLNRELTTLFGKKIKFLREDIPEQKISQKKFANEYIKTSQSHLSNLESGQVSPTLNHLNQLIEVTGLSLDVFSAAVNYTQFIELTTQNRKIIAKNIVNYNTQNKDDLNNVVAGKTTKLVLIKYNADDKTQTLINMIKKGVLTLSCLSKEHQINVNNRLRS